MKNLLLFLLSCLVGNLIAFITSTWVVCGIMWLVNVAFDKNIDFVTIGLWFNFIVSIPFTVYFNVLLRTNKK